MPLTEEVCRLCLSKERMMLPIFHNRLSKNETRFRTKIMSCASVEIFADDELPSKVCYLCTYQVEKFFQFQAMCENSDSVLRSQLKEAKAPPAGNHEEKSIINLGQEIINQEGEKYNLVQDYYSSNSQEKNFDVLTCDICASIFLSNSLLIDHLIKDHPDLNMFFCKSCKVPFSNLNLFKNHLSDHHCFTCTHCDCVFKHESNLKNHLKIHIGEYLPCKFCLKIFHDFYEMKKHELIHSVRTCGFCGKELDSEKDYNSHFEECDQRHYCKFCKQAFKIKKDLIKHVNNQHDSSADGKGSKYQQPTMLSEVQESKSESEVDQSLKCRTCQNQFSDELSLVSHMAKEHNDAVLTCKFCAKKFGLRTSLKRHERSHSGIKPYQCKFCPRKFKDSSACVVHTRTHTGEHPFRCQECHKDFKQLANLKMHTYRHHKKNKKSADVKSEILDGDGNEDYEPLYSGDIMQSYSPDNVRSYQSLNDSITSSFNQGINILMSDHQSA